MRTCPCLSHTSSGMFRHGSGHVHPLQLPIPLRRACCSSLVLLNQYVFYSMSQNPQTNTELCTGEESQAIGTSQLRATVCRVPFGYPIIDVYRNRP
ncbi:hypothetical protein J6590_034848 [Homalodisca vitripennis]|nr:hypothetical protein J6590_034848 [Homalodisca vitripennis]